MSVVIQYQGFLCSDVQVSRSRGIQPDGGCWVVIPLVRGFPKGLDVQVPQAGQDLALEADLPDLPGAEQFARPFPEQPKTLRFAGTLRLAQGGDVREIQNLYVTAVQEVVREAEDIPEAKRKSFLKVFLSDVRMFWAWGPIRDSNLPGVAQRHSFNRLRSDGSFALDSIDENGEPFSLEVVLSRFVVNALQGSPELKRLPERGDGAWERVADVDFAPHDLASVALQRVVKQYQTADVCFSWGGDVGLYDDGEGRLGYNPLGGVENTEDLPEDRILSKDLTGTSHTKTLGYPPPYAMVRGGKSIHTARVDRWEPVLQINGDFWPLNDDVLFRLTKKEDFTVDFLSKWILASDVNQRGALIDDRVARLLRDQAWLLYRLPLTEIEGDSPAVPFGPLPEGDPAAVESPPNPAGIFDPLATRRRFLRPGPYAHLLPLLNQGRVVAGKRAPVEVETYRFAMSHHLYLNSEAKDRLIAARDAFDTAKDALERQKRVERRNPFRGAEVSLDAVRSGLTNAAQNSFGRILGVAQVEGGASRFLRETDFTEVWTILAQFGIEPKQVWDKLTNLRSMREDRKIVTGAFVDIYESAWLAKLKAEDEVAKFSEGNIAPRQESLLAIAREMLKAEDELREQQGLFELRATNALARDPRNRAFFERATLAIASIAEGIAKDVNERRLQARAGGGDAIARRQPQVIGVNEGRSTDSRARVFDAAAGVIRLGKRPGWLEDPVLGRAELGPVRNVANAEWGQTRFVPQPVRVTFGTTYRPRLDAPLGAPPFERPMPRPVTGLDPALQATASRDVVPVAATDGEAWFVRHYRREPSGEATEVAPENSGLGPVIHRRELVLLVNLDGETNVGRLEERAENAARQAFRKRDLTEGRSVTISGPWLVNPDGVVAQCQIKGVKEGGALVGFETVVTTGGRAVLNSLPTRSRARVRPRPNDSPDSVAREGVREE